MHDNNNLRMMMAMRQRIIVPPYQRAYSWETPQSGSHRITQTDTFIADLENHLASGTTSPYYFGHFLFERLPDSYAVIDGQQRLTTVVIFLCALFEYLDPADNSDEREIYEDMVRRGRRICFSTVDYDNTLFVDHVIEGQQRDHHRLETESARRIVAASEYFRRHVAGKSKKYLKGMVRIISQAHCTTHEVQRESEAIQMFIFHNNRGKRPSNLEIVKAQFMHHAHLHAGDECRDIIQTIKARFEGIYKSIASIEHRIDEDEVLLHALRVFRNNLGEEGALAIIGQELDHPSSIEFIVTFTRELAIHFENLAAFYGRDEQSDLRIHSLITLGGIGIALPFMLKAYRFGLDLKERGRLAAGLEAIVLRHRLISTRAGLAPRLQTPFGSFTADNKTIEPILERIDMLKKASDSWWGYWNDRNLLASLQGDIPHGVAKHLLWRYENHLRSTEGERGYEPARFQAIACPELEHIAPTTEPSEPNHGYGPYTQEFRECALNCLGNFLLASKSHNASLSNQPFAQKRIRYNELRQQREVAEMGANDRWDMEMIHARQEKIVASISSFC